MPFPLVCSLFIFKDICIYAYKQKKTNYAIGFYVFIYIYIYIYVNVSNILYGFDNYKSDNDDDGDDYKSNVDRMLIIKFI